MSRRPSGSGTGETGEVRILFGEHLGQPHGVEPHRAGRQASQEAFEQVQLDQLVGRSPRHQPHSVRHPVGTPVTVSVVPGMTPTLMVGEDSVSQPPLSG